MALWAIFRFLVSRCSFFPTADGFMSYTLPSLIILIQCLLKPDPNCFRIEYLPHPPNSQRSLVLEEYYQRLTDIDQY
jgi:hypothetical protein